MLTHTTKQTGKNNQWKGKKNADAFKNRAIQPGDSGIWVTCDKGREGKCTSELRDFFNQVSCHFTVILTFPL